MPKRHQASKHYCANYESDNCPQPSAFHKRRLSAIASIPYCKSPQPLGIATRRAIESLAIPAIPLPRFCFRLRMTTPVRAQRAAHVIRLLESPVAAAANISLVAAGVDQFTFAAAAAFLRWRFCCSHVTSLRERAALSQSVRIRFTGSVFRRGTANLTNDSPKWHESAAPLAPRPLGANSDTTHSKFESTSQ